MAIAVIILEYLKVLAWPMVVVICFWIIRREVVSLVNRLTELDLQAQGFRLRIRVAARMAASAVKSASLPTSRTKAVSQENVHGDDKGDLQDPLAKLIWTLSDQNLMFLHKLGKQPWRDDYSPSDREEGVRYDSLCKDRVFIRFEGDRYKTTELGRRLVSYLQ